MVGIKAFWMKSLFQWLWFGRLSRYNSAQWLFPLLGRYRVQWNSDNCKIKQSKNTLQFSLENVENDNLWKCSNICFVAYYDGHWDVRYIRQCAKQGEVGPAEGRWCKERSGNFRVKVKVCHCDNKDGCNDATGLRPGWTTVMTTLVLSMMFVKGLSFIKLKNSETTSVGWGLLCK